MNKVGTLLRYSAELFFSVIARFLRRRRHYAVEAPPEVAPIVGDRACADQCIRRGGVAPLVCNIICRAKAFMGTFAPRVCSLKFRVLGAVPRCFSVMRHAPSGEAIVLSRRRNRAFPREMKSRHSRFDREDWYSGRRIAGLDGEQRCLTNGCLYRFRAGRHLIGR